MQQIVPIGEIRRRAEAIGISLKTLALDAGVHASTAYRVGERDSRTSTVTRLVEALERREQALFEHLRPIVERREAAE